jgi:glycosyltransferase involved in cell wall biosynthesis
VAGNGPEALSLRAIAGPNVTFKGSVSDGEMRALMAGANALIFAAEEDFGIVPVEAQAEGTPVLALGRGGARETVAGEGAGQTGMFFESPEAESIAACVNAFLANRSVFSRVNCQANACNFEAIRFRQRFKSLVDREMERVRFENHSSREVSRPMRKQLALAG